MNDQDIVILGNIYNSLLLERQFHYNLPKDDKRKLMYDFYVVSFLNQFDLKHSTPGRKVSGFGELIDTPTMRRELDENTKDSFIHAKEQLLGYLKPHFLRALFFAICAEFRHVFSNNKNSHILEFFKKRDAEEFIRKYAVNYKALNTDFGDFLKQRTRENFERFENDHRGYLDSYKSVKNTGIEEEKFIQLAKDSFLELNWSASYGGNSWANICDGWIMLHGAESEDDKFVAIDHVYDLQHNTDTVFNKLKSYYDKEEKYRWIKKALDQKANVQSPYELLDNVSPVLKSMALRILKSEGYSGWEEFVKDKVVDKDISSESKLAKAVKKEGEKGVWKGGTWKRGTWNGVLWISGVWEGGIWKGGRWKNGAWKGGRWKGGIWENGAWHSGDWTSGVWMNGKWYDGYWHTGQWHNGQWFDGIWHNGVWHNGRFETGKWKNGIWKDGIWGYGTWENGTWENGTWMGGIWKGGEWKTGIWVNGRWDGGQWGSGQWGSGFIYDPHKVGNYEFDWEWQESYVKSPINPAEYFGGPKI